MDDGAVLLEPPKRQFEGGVRLSGEIEDCSVLAQLVDIDQTDHVRDIGTMQLSERATQLGREQ